MKNNNVQFTFGADPELFLFDKRLNRVVSSIPILKRDKHNPIELGRGSKLYADNALVEIAFAPSNTKQDFINSLRTVFAETKKRLGNRYTLLPQAVHRYKKSELKDRLVYIENGRKKEMTAWDIGCNPNFDIYRHAANMPKPFKDGMRTGSFHLHLGNKNYKTEPNGLLVPDFSKAEAVKLMDIFVGVSSILFDKDETAPARRKLYGKAGEFRPTPYGVEYRVLGNFALRSPELVSLVFDLTNHALSYMVKGNQNQILGKIDANRVIKTINNNDKKMAMKILSEANLPKDLMQRVNMNWEADFEKAWGI